jgi:metallo-beta-lactamase family protein
MYMTFYGAVREVTGSMHLLTTETDRILFDCGMFQGNRKESEIKNRMMPFDPRIITNLVLSHAHLDHSGRIPLFVKNNFTGRIYCTRPTADACHYLLLDSAHIQESDAEYLNYKTARSFMHSLKSSPNTQKVSKRELKNIKKTLKHSGHKLNTEAIDELINTHHLKKIQPLYTTEDAENSLEYFSGQPYNLPFEIGNNMTCTFYDAGHILGSSICIVKFQENGQEYRVAFTGDIGRFDNLLIMESTYGNRDHEPVKNLKNQLKKVLNDTFSRGGSVIIPSFAFGRTQELVYVLHELYDENEVPRIPIYVDSPLARNITRVFGEHPEVYDDETHKTFLEKGENPFSFKQMNFVKTVEESMALNRETKPHVVIASSGMCEAGRILHHLRHKIHNPANTILVVGYMAQNTLGRRILESGKEYEESGRTGAPPLLRFYNKVYPLHAHVIELGGFSAHGDRTEMLRFLKNSNLNVRKIAVVHGEESQSLAFSDLLNKEGFNAFVPHSGETVHIR